jgi:hypothetical protein
MSDVAGVIWRAVCERSEAGDRALRSEAPRTMVKARELAAAEGDGVCSGVAVMLLGLWAPVSGTR